MSDFRLTKSPPEWSDVGEASVDEMVKKTTWVRYWFKPSSEGHYIWVPQFLLNEPNQYYISLSSPVPYVSQESQGNSAEGLVFNQGANMSEAGKTLTRRGQIGGGFVGGLKKGTLQSTSKRVAAAVADVLPLKTEAAESVAQFALLTVAAEVGEKVPDAIGSKIGLTSERKFAFGEMCRNLAGENGGRHLVDIMTEMAPQLAEVFAQVSKDDIVDATAHRKQESEEAQSEEQKG